MTKKYNYSFSAEKNYKLISERKVSFEEIISVIESNCLLDIIEHPNPDKYSDQKMYIVKFNEYAYLVPFITEVDGTVFLKTIIPSRKATQKYLKVGKSNEK
ncbi:MAG TPA: toxin [Rickettsia endosymbiont of Omalisus fontisbellaquei]|nr:toxin [Rickettsia endosymbiont of Omalisus fontisbellaquei]